MHGNHRLEKKLKLSIFCSISFENCIHETFHCVHVISFERSFHCGNSSAAEYFVSRNRHFSWGNFCVSLLAKRFIWRKYCTAINIEKSFSSLSRSQCFSLERIVALHMTTFSTVPPICAKSLLKQLASQTRFYRERLSKTLNFFDKVETFTIEYMNEQKLFNNKTTIDFDFVCVQEENFKTMDPGNGFKNIFLFVSPFFQVWSVDQFFFATLVLITPLHL